MKITLEKEIIYEILDEILETFTLDKIKKSHVRKSINVDEVVNFIENNISQLHLNNFMKDFENLLSAEINTLDDFIDQVLLLTKCKALERIVESATTVIHEASKILTTDEKTNLLIDFKTSDSNDYISKIMENYLIGDLQYK